MKKIICTVTNDLSYDQRMMRICTSLASAGYQVVLVGRTMPHSIPLQTMTYQQKRIACWFSKGALFYAEYNLRLFCWLLFQQTDCICAIDLDTILPCYFASNIKRTKRVYDAHELFCEMKEVVSRPSRYKIWKSIERFTVPKFKYGYTVCAPISAEFKTMYGVDYAIIRNVPIRTKSRVSEPSNKQPFLLYQGAVNEGRSFETLIPAMQQVEMPLHIYGDGNFLVQTKALIEQYQLQEKVILQGKRTPAELQAITATAFAGITLFENNGKSNYLSLANRFFDYIQAGIPQICVNYPAYKSINDVDEIALLLNDTSTQTIANGLNNLIQDPVLYQQLQANCLNAATKLNWQEEEKTLIQFYKSLFE